MKKNLSLALVAVPFAIFLLVLPLFVGEPITWWNALAAALFLLVFYASRIYYDRRTGSSRPRGRS